LTDAPPIAPQSSIGFPPNTHGVIWRCIVRRSLTGPAALPILLASLAAQPVSAQEPIDLGCDDDDLDGPLDDVIDDDTETSFIARLRGLCEVPSISSDAVGEFTAEIDDASSLITWTLTYDGLETPVEQAHIHLSERHVNGGISVFLCTNLDNGPADTQACPEGSASLTGAITPDHVIGPEDQGLAQGAFEELVRAIRAEATYVNVHTTAFPAGEIRGQIVEPDD